MEVQSSMKPALRQRLLRDIDELLSEPYPGITLHLQDGDELKRACLILETEGYGALHLTVDFSLNYPLSAPAISIQSEIAHPNVFGDYLCATILNTREDYTAAYTLKTIAIQLLSFFSSDTLEQDDDYDSDPGISLAAYKERSEAWKQAGYLESTFQCDRCSFGNPALEGVSLATETGIAEENGLLNPAVTVTDPTKCPISLLPTELVLRVMEMLSPRDLLRFRESWNRAEQIATNFDLVRIREMVCFVTKKSWRDGKMGIGVGFEARGKGNNIQSEFEYLSASAFQDLKIRHSIHGIEFETWLPLPISLGHWRKVAAIGSGKSDVMSALKDIQRRAGIHGDPADVIISFMNDVVVQLNEVLQDTGSDGISKKSTLRHASEKAIEAYFQLFHLLVCLAVDDPRIVRKANDTIKDFLKGKTSKTDVPNLGHLLIAQLISDIPAAKVHDLIYLIVKEAITRNVVWLLNKHPELSYIEPADQRSDYRLTITFAGSLTSYRLLMFSELFRQIVHALPTTTGGEPGQKEEDDSRSRLEKIRDTLFLHHGSPPPGTAEKVAVELRRLQTFRSFLPFLGYMNLSVPSPVQFSAFLRATVSESMAKGYSVQGLPEGEALILRKAAEPGNKDLPAAPSTPMLWTVQDKIEKGRASFFPGKRGGGGRSGGRGRR